MSDDLVTEAPAPAEYPEDPNAYEPKTPYVPLATRETAAARAPAMPSYEDLIKQDAADKKLDAEFLRYQAEHASEPGKSLEVTRYRAAHPDVPVDVIENNLELFRADARASQLDYKKVVEDHPTLAKWIGDPATAGMAVADSAALSGWEAVTGRFGSKYIPAPWMEITRDVWTQDMPMMGLQFKEATEGIFPWGDRANRAERQKSIMEYKAQSTQGKDYVFAKSALADAFLFPFKIQPVIAANLLAAPAGPVGLFAVNTIYGLPGMYDALSNVQSPSGEKLSEQATRIASWIGAPLSAIPMTWGFSPIVAGAERAWNNAMLRTAANALKSDSIAQMLGGLVATAGTHWVEGAASFALMNGVQAAVERQARHFALGDDSMPDEAIYEAMREGFLQGLRDLPAMSAMRPMGVVFKRLALQRRAMENFARAKTMGDEIEASKLAKEDPEQYANFLRQSKERPGAAKVVYLDRETLEDHIVKNGLVPREVIDKVLGEGAYDRLDPNAQDIVVPIERSQQLFEGKAFRGFMEQEARFHPEDESLGKLTRDAQVLMQEVINKEKDKDSDPERQRIYQETYDRSLAAAKNVSELAAHAEDIAKASASLMLRTVLWVHELTGRAMPLTEVYHTQKRISPRAFGKLQWEGGDALRPGITDPETQRLVDSGAARITGQYSPALHKITLFRDAGLSTPLHEVIHSIVETMAEMTRAENGAVDREFRLREGRGPKPDEMMANLGPIGKGFDQFLKVFGYRDVLERLNTPGGVVANEERITHAFELWAASDKAPSKDMASVFALMRLAMYEGRDPKREFEARYQGRKLDPAGVSPELTPEQRAMFALVYRSNEEVLLAQRATKIMERLDAAYEKMTPEEQASYDALSSTSTINATDLLAKWISENSRQVNAGLFKTEREKLAKEGEGRWKLAANGAAEIFKNDKVPPKGWGAKDAHLLEHPEGGVFKFDPEEIRHSVDPTYFEKLKREVPWIFAKDADHAMEANSIAKVFAYRDPLDMITDLYMAGSKTRYVEHYVESKMRDIFGPDLIDKPGDLFEKAAELTHDNKAFQKLVLELRAMARGIDPTLEARVNTITKERMERTVNRLLASKAIGEINPELWMRAERRASEKAFEFAEKGNLAKAWDHKYQQLLNFMVYKAMREYKVEIDKQFAKLEGRMTEDSYRAALGKADPAARDAHDAILDAIGVQAFPGGIDPAVRVAKLDAFFAWATDNSLPINQFNDEVLRDILAGSRTWDQLLPHEAKAVLDAAYSIKHMADQAHNLKIGEWKADRQELIDAALKHTADLKDLGKPRADKALEGTAEKVWRAIKARDANLLEPRVWLGFLGPEIKDAVWGEFLKARDNREKLMKDIHQQFEKDWKEYAGKKDRYTVLPESIDTELPMTSHSGQRSKMWLMTVMFWMGNEESRNRLLSNFGWSEDQVTTAAGKYLTPEDLAWIQKQHKLADEKLFPLETAKHERRTGLPLEKVKAMPYTIKFAFDGSERTYDGGYFPIKYDERTSKLSLLKGQEEVEGRYPGKPSTNKGYTKTRSESYKDVPNLDWEIYPAHLAEVIHDLAFDEYVSSMSRLLLNKEMRGLMQSKLGEQLALQPLAWLTTIARDADGSTPAHLRELTKSMQYARGALLYGALGWNAAVVAADILHPIASGLMREGTWYTVTRAVPAMLKVVGSGVASILGGGDSVRDIALSKSIVLQYRNEHAYQEMRRLLSEPGIGGTTGPFGRARDAVRATAFWLMETVDKSTSAMIWKAKYDQIMAEGEGSAALYSELRRWSAAGAEGVPPTLEDMAIKLADEAVSSAMPTHAVSEMPALLRDKRGAGAMLVFYGYYSKLYNMARERGHEVAAGRTGSNIGWESAKLAGRIMGMMIVTNVWGDYLMGHGKQDDETWGEWYLRKTLAAPFAMIPYAGSLVTPVADVAVTGKAHPTNILRAPAYALAYQGYDTIGRLMSGKRENDQKIFDAMEFLLMSAQLPARQPRRTAEYLYNVAQGTEHPRGIAEFAGKTVYGSKRVAEKNPLTSTQDLIDGR